MLELEQSPCQALLAGAEPRSVTYSRRGRVDCADRARMPGCRRPLSATELAPVRHLAPLLRRRRRGIRSAGLQLRKDLQQGFPVDQVLVAVIGLGLEAGSRMSMSSVLRRKPL